MLRLRAVVVALALTAAVLTGCSPASNSPITATPTPSSSADAADLHWPEGASADTRRCSDASAATVAAVNTTITNPQPGEGVSVSELQAHPDPSAGVWILTGHISAGAGASIEVAWATIADPTAQDFSGGLRSVGEHAATISNAPPLALPVNNLDGSGIPSDACH